MPASEHIRFNKDELQSIIKLRKRVSLSNSRTNFSNGGEIGAAGAIMDPHYLLVVRIPCRGGMIA